MRSPDGWPVEFVLWNWEMSSETITDGNNNSDLELHEFLATSLELWGPGNAEYDVF